MKKVFALIVAVALLFIMSIPAYAVDELPVGASDLPMMMSRGAVYHSGNLYAGDVAQSIQAVTLFPSNSELLSSSTSYNFGSSVGTNLCFYGENYRFGSFVNSLKYTFNFSIESPTSASSVNLIFINSYGTLMKVPVSDFQFINGSMVGSVDFILNETGFGIHALQFLFSDAVGNTNTDFKINEMSICVADSDNSVNVTSYKGTYFTGSTPTTKTYNLNSFVSVPTNDPGLDFNSFEVVPIVTLKSDMLYYYDFSANVSDDWFVAFIAKNGTDIKSTYYSTVDGNLFRISGFIDTSEYGVTNPLLFKLHYYSGVEGVGSYFALNSCKFIPVSELSSNPSNVFGDFGLASFIGSWFDKFMSYFKSQEDKSETDYDQSYNPGVDDAIGSAGSQVDQIEQAEGQIWNDLDTSMGEIDVGSVSIPSSILGSMMWINNIWTSCFNLLPSDWQFLITFPMFLGIALVIIGRAGQAVISADRRMSRTHDKGGVDKGA